MYVFVCYTHAKLLIEIWHKTLTLLFPVEVIQNYSNQQLHFLHISVTVIWRLLSCCSAKHVGCGGDLSEACPAGILWLSAPKVLKPSEDKPHIPFAFIVKTVLTSEAQPGKDRIKVSLVGLS